MELQECLRDLWLLAIAGDCGCVAGNPLPECLATDCEGRRFVWLGRPEFAGQGRLLISQELGTFSSWGQPASALYLITAGTLEIDPDNEDAFAVTCEPESMGWRGEGYSRAPSGMSNAVDAAWGDGSGWSGEPVSVP